MYVYYQLSILLLDAFQLLQKDCQKRLGADNDFQDIKEHPFFASIDFEKLLRKEIRAPFIPKIKDELDISHIDKEFTSVQPNPGNYRLLCNAYYYCT